MMNNLFSKIRSISKTARDFQILNVQFNIRRICANNRCYSYYYNTIPRPKDALGRDEFDQYESHFQEVVQHFTTSDNVILPEVQEYFKEIMNYNVPGHEQATGPLVVSSYKNFCPPEKQTSENIRLACIVGWVNDMIGNSFQITDDIFDSSQMRINKPCWYKVENVGLKAVQHSAAVGDGAFMILRHFLSGHPNYIPIIQLTEEIKFKTSLGQILDLMSEKQIQYFIKEKYIVATMYRGTYLAIVHPVCAGMYLAGVVDQKLHSEVRAILFELGVYFAVQNDVLDCYGKAKITGKDGTDIQTGKNTWLAVQAMADGNPLQKQLFQEHYGKEDLESKEVIYALYKELEILKKFLIYERDSYIHIGKMIENLSDSTAKKPILNIVNTFYGKL